MSYEFFDYGDFYVILYYFVKPEIFNFVSHKSNPTDLITLICYYLQTNIYIYIKTSKLVDQE